MSFSIVARDPQNGWLGMATASRALAAGAAGGPIKLGVGAIASQAFANPLPGDRRAATDRGWIAAGAGHRAGDRQRRRARPAATRHRRSRGARGGLYRRPLHPLGGPPDRRGLRLPRQHPQERGRGQGDGDSLRAERGRPALRAPNAGAGRRRGSGRRPARPAGRRHRSAGRGRVRAVRPARG
ncbi:MAG: DUF1028 domain-containing protein [Chloroflexi bacterium]|nr:MAG: DUF1028 domain-containing protein [Chloroflexota bacterium]